MHNKITHDFFRGTDVTRIAKELLGKILCTNLDNRFTTALIVETEAYCGATDRACHAFPNKKTKRTEVMYRNGGIAYVYLVYGMHHLFNIVTNTEGKEDAVLIRAVEPLVGLEIMQERRTVYSNDKGLTGGPARLTQAMGITVSHNEMDLLGDKIWLTEGKQLSENKIVATTRIGVEYAAEDAFLPWRFYIKGNKYVSK
jgi:DNA-3-methyladenine glycosylase